MFRHQLDGVIQVFGHEHMVQFVPCSLYLHFSRSVEPKIDKWGSKNCVRGLTEFSHRRSLSEYYYSHSLKCAGLKEKLKEDANLFLTESKTRYITATRRA